MNFRQLQHFVTVAEELHFSRAADRLRMTQPPLSQSIRALEEELGVQLFHRTKRTVRLTPVAREWLPHAARILDDLALLPDRAARLSRGEIGTIRLAFISFASYSFLPRLLSHFREASPNVEVALSEATSDLQIDQLLSGDLDIGIVIPPPSRAMPGALDYATVASEELVVAVPTNWILDERVTCSGDVVKFESLQDKPLVLFPRRNAPSLHDAVTRYYAGRGASPTIVQQAVQMQTIINLVTEGMGIAFVPSCMRSLSPPGVSYLRLEEGAPRTEIGVAWKPESASVSLKRFIEFAMKLDGVRIQDGNAIPVNEGH